MAAPSEEGRRHELNDFLAKPVPELKTYLSARGISVTGKLKSELSRLAHAAYEDKLPVKTDNDYIFQNRKRRTVNGTVLPNPTELNSEQWTSNLNTMPPIDSFDVHMYLKTVCEWSGERFKRRKSDNGWQLHANGHIHDVKLCNYKTHTYIRAKSVPETRQSADPYELWVLLGQTGQIHSAECTCVA
jgi:hypothetical protein